MTPIPWLWLLVCVVFLLILFFGSILFGRWQAIETEALTKDAPFEPEREFEPYQNEYPSIPEARICPGCGCRGEHDVDCQNPLQHWRPMARGWCPNLNFGPFGAGSGGFCGSKIAVDARIGGAP